MTELDIFKLENFLELLGVRNIADYRQTLLAHIGQGFATFEMDYEFSFEPGTLLKLTLHFFLGPNGRYYLLKYRAELHYEGDPSKNERQVFFMNERRITFREAYNLLQGRYVEKLISSRATGEKRLYWIKLNFHDKDKYGNYLYYRYQSAPAYWLEKVLDLYPNILELTDPCSRAAIIQSLKIGNREKVTIVGASGPGIQKFIEANPKMGTLRIESSPREVRRRKRIPLSQSRPANPVAGALSPSRHSAPLKIAV